MIKRCVAWLANVTVVFDALRWLLEAGYSGERRIIRESLLPLGARVLDLGCGTGIFAPLFAPDAYCGVDVNPRYLARARQRCPRHTFLLGDGARVPLDDGWAGAVMISGVLHHLDDGHALRLLREAARALRPGGVIVIWEDTADVAWWNVIGRVLHLLDNGAFIRRASEYQALVARVLAVDTVCRMRSGFMEYCVMHCKSAP